MNKKEPLLFELEDEHLEAVTGACDPCPVCRYWTGKIISESEKAIKHLRKEKQLLEVENSMDAVAKQRRRYSAHSNLSQQYALSQEQHIKDVHSSGSSSSI